MSYCLCETSIELWNFKSREGIDLLGHLQIEKTDWSIILCMDSKIYQFCENYLIFCADVYMLSITK